MAIKIPEERDVYPYVAWSAEDVQEGVEVRYSIQQNQYHSGSVRSR